MPKRVLICRSNDINPDPRVEKIATALVNNGYKTEIIGWQRTQKLNSDQTPSDLPITRIYIPAKFGSGFGNLFKLVKWQFKLFAFLVKKRKGYEIIHACDFDTVIPAFMTKLLFNKKLIYDIFDFYADHIQINSTAIKKTIRQIDKFVINQANAIIIVDESRLAQINGTNPQTLEVIYNTPNDINQRLTKDRTARQATLNLTFVGVIQADRGIEELLTVLENHPDWHLDLAGFGSYSESLMPLIRRLNNVSWHGKVDYLRALELNAAADILVAIYDPKILNNKYSSPNKLYEAMMLSKPIIVSRQTTMAEKVDKYNIGLSIDYGDTAQLEQALLKLENSALREKMGQKGRGVYEQHFSWDKMEKRLINLYSKISN